MGNQGRKVHVGSRKVTCVRKVSQERTSRFTKAKMKGPRNALARYVLGQSLDKRPHSSVKDTRKVYNDAAFETITKTISRALMLDNSDRFALPKQVRGEKENFLKPHGRHLDEMQVFRDPKTEKYTISDTDGFTVSFFVKGEEPVKNDEPKIPDDGY